MILVSLFVYTQCACVLPVSFFSFLFLLPHSLLLSGFYFAIKTYKYRYQIKHESLHGVHLFSLLDCGACERVFVNVVFLTVARSVLYPLQTHKFVYFFISNDKDRQRGRTESA